jgi:hypothetical protein
MVNKPNGYRPRSFNKKNKGSELLSFLDWFKTKPELSEWNNDVILDLYKNDKKR